MRVLCYLHMHTLHTYPTMDSQVPVWKLVASLPPTQLASALDLSGVKDALGDTPQVGAALSTLAVGKDARSRLLEENGVRCYTTATGWAGYSDERVKALMQTALEQGFTQFKMKVGLGPEADARRARLMRGALDDWSRTHPPPAPVEGVAEELQLMMDANSVWEVGQAVVEMESLAQFGPWWIEEPISCDDVVGQGHIAKALAHHSILVASGEQCQNKIMMKQFLEMGLGINQADGVKMGGLNEWITCALMAHAKGVPSCPLAGGVGLCNMAAHLSCIDFACISGQREGRTTEYVDHLQEHFVSPVALLRGGRYAAPTVAGWGLDMKEESLAAFEYPDGDTYLVILSNLVITTDT